LLMRERNPRQGDTVPQLNQERESSIKRKGQVTTKLKKRATKSEKGESKCSLSYSPIRL